jgi:hypothetical protein
MSLTCPCPAHYNGLDLSLPPSHGHGQATFLLQGEDAEPAPTTRVIGQGNMPARVRFALVPQAPLLLCPPAGCRFCGMKVTRAHALRLNICTNGTLQQPPPRRLTAAV